MIEDRHLERARALHESSLVVDLHADTFLAVRYRKADIARRHRAPIGWAPFMLHCDLPRWREGGVKAQGLGVVATKLMTLAARRGPRDDARDTFALMRRTIEANPDTIALVRSPEELEAAVAAGKLAGFAGIEGAHVYEGDVSAVEEFHELGASYVTLSHFFANELVSSSNERKPTFEGITSFGKDVIRELERSGTLVDLAHVHEKSFFAALDAMKAPPIVSHGGARALRDHHRNLTDEQLRAIADRGGVVGVIFFPWYLSTNPLAGIECIADHVCYVAEKFGAKHVALGSDWDGFVWMPRGLPDVAALPRLTAELLRRGVGEEDVRGILGANFLRVWREARAVAGARPAGQKPESNRQSPK